MTLGSFIFSCLRTAGDPEGVTVHFDAAVRYARDAVAYVLSKVNVLASRTYTQAVANDSIACSTIYPTMVTKNDIEVAHVSRLDKTKTSGWYEEMGRIYFVEGLEPGDEVVVYGRLRAVNLSSSYKDYELVYGELETGQLQWVPDSIHDVVRYRILKRMCEDMGQIERAQYFGGEALRAERENLTTINVPNVGDTIQGEDFLG